MFRNSRRMRVLVSITLIFGLSILATSNAWAHCDTLDGPVVKDARTALENGDVTLVLKWVKKEHEEEIKTAFNKTLAVRSGGDDARHLAETWFFETLVRIHRAGEGAPFTGLKPAGSGVPHAVVAADKALEGELSVDEIVNHLSTIVAEGIRNRFAEAAEKKEQSGQTVEAGREYVAAYVDYVHYIEGIALLAEGSVEHAHGESGPSAASGNHQH